MIKTLQDFFNSITAPSAAQSPEQLEHLLQLATAVLLVEVMRSDAFHHAAERNTVVTTLRSKFALNDEELERLVELAQVEAGSAYDYQRFTSRLNDHFSQQQKIRVVESMWQVAYADQRLDAHENHVISKVAGLLHVTHGEYIAAKMRAKEAAQMG